MISRQRFRTDVKVYPRQVNGATDVYQITTSSDQAFEFLEGKAFVFKHPLKPNAILYDFSLPETKFFYYLLCNL